MSMDLRAFGVVRKSSAEKQAADTAQRTAAHMNAGLLFKKVPAPVQAAIVAKAAGAPPAPAAQPVAVKSDPPAAGNLAATVKAIVEPAIKAMAQTTAALASRTPAQKAPAVPAAPPAAQARRSSGNPPLVPMRTPGQLRREVEEREQAKKSAARAEADRVLVVKSGARTLTYRTLDPSLSDGALRVLAHVIEAWKANDERPVRANAASLATRLGISVSAAQSALTELNDKRLLISHVNSLGVALVQPGLTVARA